MNWLFFELFYLVKPLIKKFLVFTCCCFVLKKLNLNTVFYGCMFNKFEYGVQVCNIHAYFSFIKKIIALKKQVVIIFISLIYENKPFSAKNSAFSHGFALLKMRRRCNFIILKCFLVCLLYESKYEFENFLVN